jgi:hypothetical protein
MKVRIFNRRSMIKHCIRCGAEFTTATKQKKYCSERCYKKQKHENFMKRRHKLFGVGICECCKNTFNKNKQNQRFCSSTCSGEYVKPNKYQKQLIVNYFEKIDTPKKAYWLGFLYGDGYITKNNRNVKLCLAEEDEWLLDDFAHDVGLDTACKRYYGPYASNRQRQIHLRICNKYFVQFLISHGCHNKKSLTIRFPNIDYSDAFLLGIYDADGGRGTSTLTSGSENFLIDIKTHFKINNNVHGNKNVFTLTLGNVLMRGLFKKYNFGIQRKRFVRDFVETCSAHNHRLVGCIRPETRKFDPLKEELIHKLTELKYNFCAIGRHYGVSDNAVRKRCKLYGISTSKNIPVSPLV